MPPANQTRLVPALMFLATTVSVTACQPEPASPVEEIELSSDSIAIQFRDSASELTATPLGHLGTELPAEVTWKSRDTNVAKVEQLGRVARLIPVTIGTATIEARAQTIVATAKVVVLDTVYAVAVVAADTMVSKSATTTFEATVDGPSSASKDVTWSVVDPRVAQLSSPDVNPVTVTALDTGVTEIIATSTIDGRKKGSAVFKTAWPTELAFALQPPQSPVKIYAQNSMSPGPQVIVLDQLGNIFAGTSDVTVALTPGSGDPGAKLFGTLTQTGGGSFGARFDDIGVDRAGSNFTLTASAPNLGPAVSSPFSVLTECAGQPYLLGTQQPGTLSTASCEPIPGNFYDRLIVNSTSQQYFLIKTLSSFGARHSVVDPEGGLNPIRGDSAYYVVGPGTFNLRVWSSEASELGPYEILTRTNPSSLNRPACGANLSAECFRVTHIGRNVNFQDETRTSNVTMPDGRLGVYSNYRFVVRPNQSPTITMAAPSPPAAPFALDPLLRVCREGTDECLQDDNGLDGRNATLTIPAANRERSFIIFAWLKPPAALRSPFTLFID